MPKGSGIPLQVTRDGDATTLLATYAITLLSGQILIPFMVIVALIQRNRYSKSPFFLNFCFLCILYCTGLLLTLYSGDWTNTVKRTTSKICGLQVVWVSASPASVLAAEFVLIAQLWISVRHATLGSTTGVAAFLHEHRVGKWIQSHATVLMLTYPWLCGVPFGIVAMVAGKANRKAVALRYGSCTLKYPPIRIAIMIFYAFHAIPAGYMLAESGMHLYRRRLAIKQVRLEIQGWEAFSLFFRLTFLFITLIAAIIGAALSGGDDKFRAARLLLLSITFLMVFIALGSNPELYKPDPVEDVPQAKEDASVKERSVDM